MLRFFKRRGREERAANPAMYKWQQAIDIKQRQWAETIQAKLLGYSSRSLKTGLIGFCLVSSGICAYIVFQALTATPVSISITPIHTDILVHGKRADSIKSLSIDSSSTKK